MKHLLPLLTLPLLLLTACQGKTQERRAARGENYVPDADHLYFKNTRLREYAAEDKAEGLTIYTHDDVLEGPARVVPILIDNWINDRARLRFDLRADGKTITPNQPFRLDVRLEENWDPIPLNVPPANAELVRLRHYLATSQDLRLVIGLDTLDAFPADSRRDVKEVVDDYLRLVDYR